MLGEIKISVRPLVEYVFKSGSIETGFRSAAAMVEGTKAHQKIQQAYKENDQKEVYLRTEVSLEGLVLNIEGRCDGLLTEDHEIIIDEIKSTKKDVSEIDEDAFPVHWAQAKCYAYMYAKEHNIPIISVQLTYVNVESENKAIFRKQFSFQELETFLDYVINSYLPYVKLRLHHERNRDGSIKNLKFPFPSFRKGQRMFAGAVYKTISEGKNLFANAPTGIGKTISAVFPSIMALGEGKLKRLFYLTAKTITRQVAEEALVQLQEKGLCIHSATITAKDKVCFKDTVNCSKDICDFSNGYYDRINGAVLDILSNESIMERRIIEKYALKHRVCPFEFSLDLAYTSDVIICDYNYMFDPKVSLKRLFDEQKKHTALLIDEAHNLVDRAREMYSAALNKTDFLNLKREFKNQSREIYETSKTINDYFISVKKQIQAAGFSDTTEKPEEFMDLLELFADAAEHELLSQPDNSNGQSLLDAFFAAADFIRIAKMFDERFVTYWEKERNEVKVKLLCLDPSYQLSKMGKGYRSKVFFSATLKPMNFFMDMLGTNNDDYSLSIPSPFSKNQTDVYILPLSTRYIDRDKSFAPIADYIHKLIRCQPGNYLIFFPSYKYMQDVLAFFQLDEFNGRTIVQSTGMAEEEREEFLASFTEDAKIPQAGFAVLGGIFSEGVDLKGDRLNGVIIVGVGLPQLNAERNIMKDYFTRTRKNGYDYAYVFPGMNKILQAGGRLIRSEMDKGTIVLIDDRFLTPKYQSMLPEEWKDYQIIGKPVSFREYNRSKER